MSALVEKEKKKHISQLWLAAVYNIISLDSTDSVASACLCLDFNGI